MIVKLFVTGGTFDKRYNELNGELFLEDTHIGEILEVARCKVCINSEILMMLDSLDMVQSDRIKILEHCKATCEDRIVITHGTDTMVETALYLKEHLGDIDFPIAFTGAMVPFGFERSDAQQNLTEALALLQHISPGVYIIFHSQVIPADRARKDRANSTFVDTSL